MFAEKVCEKPAAFVTILHEACYKIPTVSGMLIPLSRLFALTL